MPLVNPRSPHNPKNWSGLCTEVSPLKWRPSLPGCQISDRNPSSSTTFFRPLLSLPTHIGRVICLTIRSPFRVHNNSDSADSGLHVVVVGAASPPQLSSDEASSTHRMVRISGVRTQNPPGENNQRLVARQVCYGNPILGLSSRV